MLDYYSAIRPVLKDPDRNSNFWIIPLSRPQTGDFDDWRRDGLSPVRSRITVFDYYSAASIYRVSRKSRRK